MVSSGSADGAREEVEETLEMLLERMMAVVEVDLWMMVAMMRRLLSGGREERWCDREDQ
jgi:hypothetical protein